MPPPITYTKEKKSVQFILQQQPNVIMAKKVECDVITKAVATLTKSNIGGGSAADSGINPPGWGGGDCPYHHNRGHLIGNALGGPGNEARNLVTLTAGTNHPFMYDYEESLRRFLLANSGGTVSYTVECNYDQNSYTLSNGFPLPGASGNPFCLFPAPAGLLVSAVYDDGKGKVTALTLANLASHLAVPPQNLGVAANYTSLWVPNGGYKLYNSPRHIANACWAADSTSLATVVNGAINYARILGHLL